MSAETNRLIAGENSSAAGTSRQHALAERVGMIVVAASAVIAIVFAVIYIVLGIGWRSQTFLGALVTPTLVVDGSQPTGSQPWTGLDAGLRSGDHIVALNDEALYTTTPDDWDTGLTNFKRILNSLSAGDTINVTFERLTSDSTAPIFAGETCAAPQNGVAVCATSYTLTAFPDIDYVASFFVPMISGAITLGLGLLVFYMRSRQSHARTVAGISFAASIYIFGLFDLNTTHQFIQVYITAATLVGGALISFGMQFPRQLPLVQRQPFMRYVPVMGALLLAALLIALHSNPPTAQVGVNGLRASVMAQLLGAGGLVLILLRQRSRTPSRVARDQVNTIMIGLTLSMIVGVVWLVNIVARALFGFGGIAINTSATTPFLVLPSLSMAYAVLQYRMFDSDRVISQTLTYAIMLFSLVIGYFLLVLSTVLIIAQPIAANNPFLIAIVVFAMALLFIPVRTRIQRRVDALYFRQRIDFQDRLEAFGRRLSSLVEFNDITAAYRAEIADALQPRQIFIFLQDRVTGEYAAPETDVRFAQHSPLIESLLGDERVIYLEPDQPWSAPLLVERARLGILNAQVIAALRGLGRLSGLVVITPPRSEHGFYTYEELRFVQNLTAQISVAVERAQVVDSLEQRVRELAVLSQVSQAVNFTIDIDATLELIYAQASRLVDATHFYITLRDTATNELYHALFIEDEDRFTEKENRRWAVGADLFSEVVRSGQPVCVADYQRVLSERGAQVIHEDDKLWAWVGVPLLTGTQGLGVLAAGNTQMGRAFGDEQVSVFANIGQLAATSLDKARLFSETNARARQLAALNDITQQIAAAEADLDKLLRLITASATEILNAEAGSLLLTVDDGSDDLEFRVVIGGAGETLTGRRIPAGRGLVGSVAQTGETVIVNDVANDPRWGGELSKGEFHTTGVLAVPLTTGSRVIGVLEVLNKQDGVNFTRADAEMLVTFAGQAAVAIENARLFQLTDIQLEARVNELETLERIDFELNRSLDLISVAQITVNAALEVTGASAGMLGIIIGEPPMLQVLYASGYDDDDMPEGVEDGLLPLDRGIAARVMRTRQPELVPDVSIDPNYIPSLRRALSQITLPMLSANTVSALMVLETDHEPRLRLADMPFLQRLVEHATIAVTNARLIEELDRANQSKSEFVSFVAHELKNPLTSIKGYSDVLLGGRGGDLNEMQKNFLATIRSNAERMNTLVSDLNDVTKLQTDNMRMELSPIDFATALTETLRPLHKQIEDKQQTLNIVMASELPPILADQGRLIQVLTNLVSNANKYTPPEGEIRITAEVDSAPRDSKGRTLEPLLRISVSDSGIGMSQEDLMRLFTPYFRSENPLAREQPGTGLGLTITRGIIQRHGGSVNVSSTIDEGTTFTFTIPLARETEAGD